MPRPAKRDPALWFITRTRQASWRVAITFGKLDLGQVYFSDRTYGDTEAALKAAQAFRDQQVKRNNIPYRQYDGQGFCVRNKNSTTSIIGVTIGRQTDDRGTRVYWCASVRQEGRTVRKTFSIKKFGYAAAYEQAAQIRAEATGIAIQPLPEPPAWLVAWARKEGIHLLPAEAAVPKRAKGKKNASASTER